MGPTLSYWSRTAAAGLAVTAALLANAGPGVAQTPEEACRILPSAPAAECLLALAAARAVQERVGVALWGGNPVPGTASTLGMRIGAMPRFTASAALGLAPMTLPPLLDRGTGASATAVVPSLDARAAIGVLPGWSPLPTVGGVGSLDLIAGGSLALLPGSLGFRGPTTAGWLAGARVGVLRESFTLPGISVTGTVGRSGSLELGDARGVSGDGHFAGAVTDLGATLAVTRRVSALRLTGAVAVDRYTTAQADLAFTSGDTRYDWEIGRLNTDRWSGFLNATWTVLIFHGSVEAGWQVIPEVEGLPTGVGFDPARWWAAAAFRVSI